MAGGTECDHPTRILELPAVMHHSGTAIADPAPVSIPLQNLVAEAAEVLLRVPVSTITDQAQAGLGD
jgi:hypothetical protein